MRRFNAAMAGWCGAVALMTDGPIWWRLFLLALAFGNTIAAMERGDD